MCFNSRTRLPCIGTVGPVAARGYNVSNAKRGWLKMGDSGKTDRFADVFARHGVRNLPEGVAEQLRSQTQQMAVFLSSFGEQLGRDLLAQVNAGIDEFIRSSAGDMMFPGFVPISPEIKEWALQQFSEEEFLAGVREIRDTG